MLPAEFSNHFVKLRICFKKLAGIYGRDIRMRFKVKMLKTRSFEGRSIEAKRFKQNPCRLDRLTEVIAVTQSHLRIKGRKKGPTPAAVPGDQPVVDQMRNCTLQENPVDTIAAADFSLCDRFVELARKPVFYYAGIEILIGRRRNFDFQPVKLFGRGFRKNP